MSQYKVVVDIVGRRVLEVDAKTEREAKDKAIDYTRTQLNAFSSNLNLISMVRSTERVV